MSNKRISELPSAGFPLAGSELLAIVQSNETRQVSVADIAPHIIAGENILVDNTNPLQPEITALTYCTNAITTGFGGLGYYTKALVLDYISNINPCANGQMSELGVGAAINIFQDPLLEHISFANLKAIYTAGIKITNNEFLVSLNFPKLEKIVLQGGALPGESYSDYLGIGIAQCPLINDISFPQLKYLNSIYLAALDVVQNINLSALESNEGTPINMFLVYNTSTQSLDISSLKSIQNFQVSYNNNLQQLNLSSIINVGSASNTNAYINIIDNTTLSEIIMPVALSNDSSCNFHFGENALSQSCVDNILAKCVGYNITGGSLDISGGNNSSPTDGDQNSDYLALTDSNGLNWNVSITI